MIALLVGLLIGFVMCIPIGPINVWVINTHIKKSSHIALAIAFGGSLMDFVYFFIIVSGISFINFSERSILIAKTIGILLIFILGLKEILSKPTTIATNDYQVTSKGLVAAILLGISIYVSNPTLILTMTGLGTFVKSLELFALTNINIFLVSFGLAIGSFLWFVFLVKIVDKYQETLRNKYLNQMVKISGGLMIGISLFMGHQLYLEV